MRSALGLAVVAIGACESKTPPTEPARSTPPPVVAVPDITSVDWPNATYELSSLGAVKVTVGKGTFRLVEDEDGALRAEQGSASAGEWTGTLVLAPARYADLDGDKHDEALLAFELASTLPDEVPHVFGVFAFTMREGDPLRIGVVTAPVKLAIEGATITSSDPPRRWRWVSGKFVAE